MSAGPSDYELAQQLQGQGRLVEAADVYARFLEGMPNSAEGHFNLGAVLHLLGRLDEAAARYARAIELRPDYAIAHDNLGNIFHDRGELHEAMESYRRAVQSNPKHASAWYNLAMGLQEMANYTEAAECFQKSIESEPNFADARWNAGLLSLLKGDFDAGWNGYEWRWKVYPTRLRRFLQPRWAGESLAGKTILLHAEQGFGDTIQFIRYAAVVKEQNPEAKVFVACQKRLLKLLASYRGIDGLVEDGGELPSFDVHAPLMSLPGILSTDMKTIAAYVPYLFSDPAFEVAWRDKMADLNGFRIGINWRGREGNTECRRRDIPLELFAALARIPGVQLISLQIGSARAELATVTEAIFDPGEDFDMSRGGFMDTAAVMKNLDLVISSDTSVPHLAGALGVPVWVPLLFVPDWRWMLDRTDSPWYPTMRLFRQPTLGDWQSVFRQIAAELISLREQSKS